MRYKLYERLENNPEGTSYTMDCGKYLYTGEQVCDIFDHYGVEGKFITVSDDLLLFVDSEDKILALAVREGYECDVEEYVRNYEH